MRNTILFSVFGLVALALLTLPALRALHEWRADGDRAAFVALHQARAAAAEAEGAFDVAVTLRQGAVELDPADMSLRRELLHTRVRRAAADPQGIAAAERVALRSAMAMLDLPDDPDVLVLEGHLALAEGSANAAKAAYGRATTVAPQSAHGWLGLAGLQRAEGDPVLAQASYEKAVAAAPGNVTALNNLGVQYLELGRKDDALRQFQQALAVDDNLASRLNAADALAALDRLEEAVVHLRVAAQLAPTSAEPHRRLGVALQRAGKLEPAAAAFSTALALERDVATSRALAGVYQGLKRFPEAVELLTQLLQQNPGAHDVAFDLARTLEAAGSGREALALFTGFIERANAIAAEAERVAAARVAVARLSALQGVGEGGPIGEPGAAVVPAPAGGSPSLPSTGVPP